MLKVLKNIGVMAATLAVSGCAHNHPRVDAPMVRSDSGGRLYADMNGNFFPNGWRDPGVVGEAALKREHSLLAAIDRDAGKSANLSKSEGEFLAHLQNVGAGQAVKGRAYVFMVGFNADDVSTARQLAAMQEAIAVGSNDVVIEFYWDGHHAKAVVDALRVWFYASGNSQLVGTRGLRRILNALSDRETVVVTYSRGASVALSALSDPDYNDGFETKTRNLPHLQDVEPPPFQPARLTDGKPIDVLMMAPAIGLHDFYAPRFRHEPGVLRDLPKRLRSLRYTINPSDPVLNKGWIIGATRFNSTELGARPGLGEQLACKYGERLYAYPVISRFGHDGDDYIRDESYRRMLQDAGVALRSPLAASSAPILTCPAPKTKSAS